MTIRPEKMPRFEIHESSELLELERVLQNINGILNQVPKKKWRGCEKFS